MNPTYLPEDFRKGLNDGSLKRPVVLDGLARTSDDEESLLFSETTSGLGWVRIPLDMIEKVEWLGEVPGKPGFHHALLYVGESSNLREDVFIQLLRARANSCMSSALPPSVQPSQEAWELRQFFPGWSMSSTEIFSRTNIPPQSQFRLRVTSKGQYGDISLDNYLGGGGPGTITATPFNTISSPVVGKIVSGPIPAGIILGVRVGGVGFFVTPRGVTTDKSSTEQFDSLGFWDSNNTPGLWVLDLKLFTAPF